MNILRITISKRIWYGLTDDQLEKLCTNLTSVLGRGLSGGDQFSTIVQVPDKLFGNVDVLVEASHLALSSEILEELFPKVIGALSESVLRSLEGVSYVVILEEEKRSGTI